MLASDSHEEYVKKYEAGYGLKYPDGHVIRLYERILKYEMGITGEKGETILDFGCGNGTHCEYFRSKGFNVYGIDIIDQAINECRKRIPGDFSHFKRIEPNASIIDVFPDTQFDIVFSNQTLYYLPNDALENTLNDFHSMLKQNGLVIATMMSVNNGYYNSEESTQDNGLRKVVTKGRLNETTYINFIRDDKHLLETFHCFKKEYTGYYDFELDNGEGSSHHCIFVGRKF